jgi:8-oxo-dGTP pyrophosphatase MutT (NUDIX family)
MQESSPAVAHPAATVVVLRDGIDGVEVLLVRRHERLAFHGGAWVFPGGRIDPQDYAAAFDPGDVRSAARVAAVREAREEAGISIAAEELRPLSRWITPAPLPKRFDAWFFVGRAADDTVVIDGSEICAHSWMRPRDALGAQRAGGIDLPPPTFVTLARFAPLPTAGDLLAAVAVQPLETFEPRLHTVPGGACTVYAGDVAYASGDLEQPGPRHRLWMLEAGWSYEQTRG